MPSSESHAQRANGLLAAGAVVGIILAASGIFEPAGAELATETIARVGEDRISKREYLGYLEILAREKRTPLTSEDQRHVLDRMIDEKLLLARGLNIGLPQSSPRVRKAIVQQVMQAALAEVSTQAIDEDKLQQFYHDNIAYFAVPPRTRLRRLLFRPRGEDSARQLADQAWQALQQGQDFEAVGKRYASEDLLPLPNTPLPDHKLLQYLGPSLTALAREMPAGSFSHPIVTGQNRVILQLVQKQAMTPRPFAEVRDRVALEYQRRRGEEAMAAYLHDLRRQSNVDIDEAFLDAIAISATPNANTGQD